MTMMTFATLMLLLRMMMLVMIIAMLMMLMVKPTTMTTMVSDKLKEEEEEMWQKCIELNRQKYLKTSNNKEYTRPTTPIYRLNSLLPLCTFVFRQN